MTIQRKEIKDNMSGVITSETQLKLSLAQVCSITISLVVAVFFLVRAHTQIVNELQTLRTGVEALVESNTKTSDKFELYSLKQQVELISMLLAKEFNHTNKIDEASLQRQIQLILNSQ